jgi:Putative transposase/Transposase zinc-binding domain
MAGPTLELADIFRRHGGEFRQQHPLSVQQGRVMRAIELCRTAALGGHVDQCGHCQFTATNYNSCRNRHCPKCQFGERHDWVQARQDELLPVPYFHVVFTLPHQLAPLALQNPAVLYGLLLRISADTMLSVAADPKHLAARLGLISVLHTWGQNPLHHPHVHMVVPGGGISLDSQRWAPCRSPRFLLPVKVLSARFGQLFLAAFWKAFAAGQLRFHGQLQRLGDRAALQRYLAPIRRSKWVVYAKPPFGGPLQVLRYLGRYTHRIAISNQRLLKLADSQVTFQWKDYRAGPTAKGVMTLHVHEFIRRFLLHVLPAGFQRIRHYGLLANRFLAANLNLCRQLLAAQPLGPILPTPAQITASPVIPAPLPHLPLCPHCRVGSMIRTQTLFPIRWPQTPDTS